MLRLQVQPSKLIWLLLSERLVDVRSIIRQPIIMEKFPKLSIGEKKNEGI